MSTVLSTPTYTPEELANMSDAERFELVDGQLMERDMSGLSSLVATRINRWIGNHVESHELGEVFQSDCGYQCFFDDPGRIRRPDGSFIRNGRLATEELQYGYLRIAPDLAVEVISPNDTTSELDRKVEEYLEAGVRLVWVINPEIKLVSIHRVDGTVTKLHERDQLSGEDVLPGFSCPLADLFRISTGK